MTSIRVDAKLVIFPHIYYTSYNSFESVKKNFRIFEQIQFPYFVYGTTLTVSKNEVFSLFPNVKYVFFFNDRFHMKCTFRVPRVAHICPNNESIEYKTRTNICFDLIWFIRNAECTFIAFENTKQYCFLKVQFNAYL